MRGSTGAMQKKDRILVVAAHPDDEVLGCGATIARLAREGAEVDIAILGEGVTARFTSRDLADRDLMELFRDDARAAANLLVARDVFSSI